jgi:ribonuclease-3
MEPPAAQLADRLGLRFTDLGLLAQALVHSSYTNEQPPPARSNDRLEFLGDAVVALVISEALFARYPDADEGELTTRRAAIVSAGGLARIAGRLQLGDYVVLGHGASIAGERARNSILAGAFEAVTGALYEEQGLEAARDWLLQVCALELDAGLPVQALKAPKSRLQEMAYAETGRPPHYRLVSAEGPHHARMYEVEVSFGGQVLGHGSGRNRRQAETAAANEALQALGAVVVPGASTQGKGGE